MVLTRWLVAPGTFLRQGTKIAVVKAPTGLYAVLATGEGVLREHRFPAGTEIESSSVIGIIAADGENIPYGRLLSLAERWFE